MPKDNQHSEAFRPFLTWQKIIDWAQIHCRERSFNKDEQIPVRPGLLYLVKKGAVRMVGTTENRPRTLSPSAESPTETTEDPEESEETFLGFVGVGHPFEIVQHPPLTLEVYAHIDDTWVIWMYWHDLDNWPHFRREVLEAFRYQHQRKLLWLSILGQKRAIDRLLGFLTILIEEYGEPTENGYLLPFSLTHSQIGSAIGATRVTITRLMGKLRQQGLVFSKGDLIHLHKVGKRFPKKQKKAQTVQEEECNSAN
jgi:CRP-like cAMP-binding protein